MTWIRKLEHVGQAQNTFSAPVSAQATLIFENFQSVSKSFFSGMNIKKKKEPEEIPLTFEKSYPWPYSVFIPLSIDAHKNTFKKSFPNNKKLSFFGPG